jgi:hypothetical protein
MADMEILPAQCHRRFVFDTRNVTFVSEVKYFEYSPVDNWTQIARDEARDEYHRLWIEQTANLDFLPPVAHTPGTPPDTRHIMPSE